MKLVEEPLRVCCLCESAGGIYAGGLDGAMVRLGPGQRRQLARLSSATVYCLAGDPSASLVYSGSGDHSLTCWRDEKVELRREEAHRSDVRALLLHEERLFSAGYEGSVVVWQASTLTPLHRVSLQRGPVFSFAFDSVKRRLFCSGWSRRTEVYKEQEDDGQLRYAGISGASGHNSLVVCSAFEGQRLVTGSLDRRVLLWDEQLLAAQQLATHPQPLLALGANWSCCSSQLVMEGQVLYEGRIMCAMKASSGDVIVVISQSKSNL